MRRGTVAKDVKCSNLSTSALSRFDPSQPKAEPLQLEYEPDENEPFWSQLNKAALVQLETFTTGPPQTSSSSPLPSGPLANVLDDALNDTCLGAQLNPEEQATVKGIVQRHAGLFSTSPDDIGLYEGIEHEIKLVPDAKPYGRQPYRYTASDRQFLERQTATLLESDIIRQSYEKVRSHQASDLSERLLTLPDRRSEAVSNSEQAQETWITIYDRTHRDASFDVGDFVWVRRQEPILQGSENLAPKFKGLYQVTRKRTPVTYDVQQVTNSAMSRPDTQVAHVSQMKRYRPPHVDPILAQPTAGDASPTPDFVVSPPEDHVPVHDSAEPVDVPTSPSRVDEASAQPPSRRPLRHRTQPRHLQDYGLSMQD